MMGAQKIRVLLFTGENNHKNWLETSAFLMKILQDAGEFVVDPIGNPEVFETNPAERYDVLLSNFNRTNRLKPEQEAGLLEFARKGKGVVIFHAANNAFPGWDEFEQMVGFLWREGTYHPPYGPYTVHIEDKNHPITKGMDDFDHTDELYSNLWRHPKAEAHILATAVPETGAVAGKPQPLVMTLRYEAGRVFHNALGHDVAAMQNPNFVTLMQRGTLWAAGKL